MTNFGYKGELLKKKINYFNSLATLKNENTIHLVDAKGTE